jgi:eukaryotic-like serine/threonine-protein kinase
MPLNEGAKVGPYVVTGRLGAGGMGEVWRARDERLGREVALKVLPDAFSRDDERVARFHAEARAASLLNHPNVVAVYDVGQEEGRAWLAMELLEGPTLRTLLDAGRVPPQRALRIAAGIASGLAATHAKGIVHRDLKPENVVVTDDDVVKILDFGIAKSSPLASSGRDETMPEAALGTAPGAFLGTVGYMSPEQVAGEAVDFRSDQFSFGTILYELVTGERAWTKATAAETLVAILREDAPALAFGNPPIPAALRRILERCFAKDPAARFASTRDLAGDVRYLLEHSDSAAAADPARVAPVPRARRLPLRAGRVAAAIMLISAAGLAAAVLGRGRPSPPRLESLAVLPFENVAGDPADDYLVDGMTESLIDRMSRLPSLRVMARVTAFRFKGTKDAQDAGRKLGVAAVVTGAVVRRGGRLILSAEAVDVRTGARLWGDRYDRSFQDLVRLQAEIASELSTGLHLAVSDPERRSLARIGTESSEAYDLFLRGRFASLQDTEAGYREAVALYHAAAAKDPSFAEAHFFEGDTYGTMAAGGFVPPAEAWARSDEGARRALDLNPDLTAAHAALACRRAFYDWDLDGAEREFRELFDGPRPPVWHLRAFSLLLWARGKTEEAIVQTERARQFDPGNVVFTLASGDYRAQAGRPGEAVGLYRAAIDAEPEDPRAYFGLAAIFRGRGDVARALESLRKGYELSGEKEGVHALGAARTEGEYDAAQLAVARVRLAEARALSRTRYVSPLELARLEAIVGEKAAAFEDLEAAVDERAAGLVFLNVDHAWDGIRGDERFAFVLKRVGLP